MRMGGACLRMPCVSQHAPRAAASKSVPIGWQLVSPAAAEPRNLEHDAPTPGSREGVGVGGRLLAEHCAMHAAEQLTLEQNAQRVAADAARVRADAWSRQPRAHSRHQVCPPRHITTCTPESVSGFGKHLVAGHHQYANSKMP